MESGKEMDGMNDMDDMKKMSTEYTVTIEVEPGSMTPLSPVVWAVHTGDNPFVVEEMGKKPKGLEALAEDGAPGTLNEALGMKENVVSHGVAAVPSGMNEPGPAGPGKSYSFILSAEKGQRLSFATMYVQSNDLFFSPGKRGIALFEMDKPVSGDITGKIMLYDAGTEKNEMPGEGMHPAPRQSMAGEGMEEMAPIQPIDKVMDDYSYPRVGETITVTITPSGM
jgi:hypothetical protein